MLGEFIFFIIALGLSMVMLLVALAVPTLVIIVAWKIVNVISARTRGKQLNKSKVRQ